MKCEDIQALFSEYYDEQTEKAGIIVLHLNGCQDCSELYEQYTRLLAGVADIQEPDVPDGFRRSLIANTNGFARGRKKHISIIQHRFTQGLSSLAAAAAVVVIVWLMGFFDTGSYENPEMFVEFAMPQAAFRLLDDEWVEHEGFPLAEFFDLDDEVYDFAIGEFDEPCPFPWHYRRNCELRQDGAYVFVFSDYDDIGFFEPVVMEVGHMGNPAAPPLFATAIVFLIIGLALGYGVSHLVKYLERKMDNAP